MQDFQPNRIHQFPEGELKIFSSTFSATRSSSVNLDELLSLAALPSPIQRSISISPHMQLDNTINGYTSIEQHLGGGSLYANNINNIYRTQSSFEHQYPRNSYQQQLPRNILTSPAQFHNDLSYSGNVGASGSSSPLTDALQVSPTQVTDIHMCISCCTGVALSGYEVCAICSFVLPSEVNGQSTSAYSSDSTNKSGNSSIFQSKVLYTDHSQDVTESPTTSLHSDISLILQQQTLHADIIFPDMQMAHIPTLTTVSSSDYKESDIATASRMQETLNSNNECESSQNQQKRLNIQENESLSSQSQNCEIDVCSQRDNKFTSNVRRLLWCLLKQIQQDPFPNDDQFFELGKKTGLDRKKLKNWFSLQRFRYMEQKNQDGDIYWIFKKPPPSL